MKLIKNTENKVSEKTNTQGMSKYKNIIYLSRELHDTLFNLMFLSKNK